MQAALPPSYTYDESSPTAVVAVPPADTLYASDGDVANSQPPPTYYPGPPKEQHDSEGEDGRTSSQSSDDKDEYIIVQLEDVSNAVQCPICLGVIRKTRTVMECLHRFCRECIDRSMRLGKKECPICRNHCASRRSLRDDLNFDALIAALYPDIDFDALVEALYPENKDEQEIQSPMAKTFRQPSEAVDQRRSAPKALAAAAMRRSQGSYQSGKNNYYRRRGKKELSWGKGGVRSQTRHSNSSVSNGRFGRAARLARLIEQHLHNLDENEDKFDVLLTLLPLNQQSVPLDSPYLCCPPTAYTRHIRQFIAIQTSVQVEGIDLFIRKPKVGKVPSEVSEEMQILGEEESLACLLGSFASSQGDLELLYHINERKDIQRHIHHPHVSGPHLLYPP